MTRTVTIVIPGRPPTPLTEDDFDLPPKVDDDAPLLHVVIDGEPIPKQRGRVTFRGGKATSYTPQRTVLAQRNVAQAVRGAYRGEVRADVDFEVLIVYRLVSWQRRDIDNMTKLVMDACTGIVWADDSQVRYLTLSSEHAEDRPGMFVAMWAVPAQRPPTSPCGHCGKPLRSFPSVTLKFCDKACRAAFAASKRTRSCSQCGSEFTPPARAPRVTCSKECEVLWHQRNSGRPRKPSAGRDMDARRKYQREYAASKRARARGGAA